MFLLVGYSHLEFRFGERDSHTVVADEADTLDRLYGDLPNYGAMAVKNKENRIIVDLAADAQALVDMETMADAPTQPGDVKKSLSHACLHEGCG